MLKMNAKYYDKITCEPIEVQEVNDKKIEIHFLNDTPFYNEFISKGRFFFWSTKGAGYKLVIEAGYFETVKDLFNPQVNAVWLNYYEETEKVRINSFKKYLLPAMILYFAFSLGVLLWLQDYAIYIFMVILLIMLVGSRFFNKFLNREFTTRNNEAITKIKKTIGKKEYETLLKNQEKYRNKFYKFEEETEEVTTVEVPNDEVLEETKKEENEEVEAFEAVEEEKEV